MQRNRILLTSLGVLAAGGSASPVLFSYNSFFSLLSLGGGTNAIENNTEVFKVTNQDLNFNPKKISGVNINSQAFKEKVFIQEIKDKDLLIQQSHQMETQKSEENIKGIIKEVGKETQTLKIDKSSTKEVVEARGKIKSSLSTYKSALQKVKNYQLIKSTRQKRSIRSTTSIPELTVSERKALADFYRQFRELKNKKITFFTELKNVDPENQTVSQSLVDECQKCENVDDALQKIGWNSQSALNIFTTNDSKWRPSSPVPNAEKWKTLWGSWDKKENPYSRFWDLANTGNDKSSARNKWVDAVNKIYQNRKKYYSTVNSASWRACGLTIGLFGGNCGYDKKGSMEQEIKDSHSEIELTIAKALLTWMSQV